MKNGRIRWRGGSFIGAFALSLVLAGACASQQIPETVGVLSPDYEAAIAEAKDLLLEVMDTESIPGLSVAVGVNGEVVWSQGLGFSDLEQQVVVDPETKFRSGSVSKPMTSVLLALLMERGALDLDAPVQTYVAEFPEKRWPITSRQVAGHIAGIRHYNGLEFLSDRPYSSVTAALSVFDEDPLEFEPGTQYSYSSYGWNLLSVVAERAGNGDFLEMMDREVFGPLGMVHTVADWNQTIIPNRTRFYAVVGGEVVHAPFVDNSVKWAGGGFLSTPEDLLRFAYGVDQGVVLQEDTRDDLYQTLVLRDGTETGYGVGWRTRVEANGDHLVGHTGGSVGGRTVLLLNREKGLAVAIMANLSSAPMSMDLAGQVGALFVR